MIQNGPRALRMVSARKRFFWRNTFRRYDKRLGLVSLECKTIKMAVGFLDMNEVNIHCMLRREDMQYNMQVTKLSAEISEKSVQSSATSWKDR